MIQVPVHSLPLSYSEDELNQHLKRVSAIREHCRNTLLEIQGKYTKYMNAHRKDNTISVGNRVHAKLKQRLSKKLDFPMYGSLLVDSPKGKAWNLKELSTGKCILVTQS